MAGRIAAFVGVAALMASLTGCAGPKVVAQSTGTAEQIKFLYTQNDKQGVIKCKVAKGGKPTDCLEMALELKE